MERLNKLAVKLNIPIKTLIDILKLEYKTEYNLNSKLTEKEVDFLVNKYENDMYNKNLASRFLKDCYFKIDENFTFEEQEIKEFQDEYSLYNSCKIDIELLKVPTEKYSLLDNYEIQTLKNLKLALIENIQKTILIHRNNIKHKHISKKINLSETPHIDISSHDNPWRNVFGNDEEASTAYWNTD